MTKTKNTTREDEAYLEHGDGLSESTRRARWIHAPDEHEERHGETLVTRSREVIEAWARERDGVPATVPGTEHNGRPGVLRIDFGAKSERLEQIAWDDWFRSFEERNLAFIFQEHKSNGSQSNFFQLDNPHREDA